MWAVFFFTYELGPRCGTLSSSNLDLFWGFAATRWLIWFRVFSVTFAPETEAPGEYQQGVRLVDKGLTDQLVWWRGLQ